MLGLLYKDFIAVKGKIILIFLSVQFVLFALMRFSFTHGAVMDSMFVVLLFQIYGVSAMVIAGSYAVSLLKTDEGKKQKQYFLSLPIDKKQYVASKFLFIAILFYILQSIFIFQIQICSINVVSEDAAKYAPAIRALMPGLFLVCLVVCGVDLLFYFGLGVDKAKRIIDGLFFILLFVVVVYFLFGDLSLMEKLNVMSILEYIQEHQEIMFALQILPPLLGCLLYYICYLGSVKLFERREWEDE